VKLEHNKLLQLMHNAFSEYFAVVTMNAINKLSLLKEFNV